MTTTTHNPTVSIDMSTTDTPIQSRSPATPAVLSTSFHPMESNTIANTNQQNITCHQQTDNQYTTIIVLIAIIVLFFVALVGLSMMLLVTCTRKQNMAESNKSWIMNVYILLNYIDFIMHCFFTLLLQRQLQDEMYAQKSYNVKWDYFSLQNCICWHIKVFQRLTVLI